MKSRPTRPLVVELVHGRAERGESTVSPEPTNPAGRSWSTAARTAVAGHSLDETFFHACRKVEMSLRWVYVRMIEEYARHNGYADLLRERIDGATGA